MSTTSSSSTFSRASAHALSYYSGSSSTSSIFSGEFRVDRNGFLDSEHQAGGPYLCSLPADFVHVSKEYDRRHDFRARSPEIHVIANSILRQKGIEWRDIVIEGRLSRLSPEPEPVPTVLMVTQTIPSEARNAAREIHQALLPQFLNICVDIINAILMQPLRSFPVARSEAIFEKWEDIAEAILSTQDFSEWASLGYWRYGVSQIPTENPITVVVSVEKSSTRQWTTATRRIQGILSQFGVDGVDILFQKNETPIIDVHEDIKRVTGAVSVRIA